MNFIARIESCELDELEEITPGWDQELSQIGRGRFHGSILLSQIGSYGISREFWGQQLHYRGTSPPGAYGLALILSQKGTSRWMGLDAKLGDIIIQRPGAEADLLASEDFEALIFSIPESILKFRAAALLGVESEAMPDLHGTVCLPPQAKQRIRSQGLEYLGLVESASSMPRFPDALEIRARELIDLMIRALVDAHAPSLESPAPGIRRRLILEADDYVAGCRDQAPDLAQICVTLGVSERTLQYAFTHTIGMTPARWLKMQRLNRVRRKLRQADPECTLVKQAALEHGFTHFGRFAKDYRDLFGELPSETLVAGS